MIVISGATAGTFVGIINVTVSAVRFLIAYESRMYSGTFTRYDNNMYKWVAWEPAEMGK